MRRPKYIKFLLCITAAVCCNLILIVVLIANEEISTYRNQQIAHTKAIGTGKTDNDANNNYTASIALETTNDGILSSEKYQQTVISDDEADVVTFHASKLSDASRLKNKQILKSPARPGRRIGRRMILDYKHNISYCGIHKNCHTQFSALFCRNVNPNASALAKEPMFWNNDPLCNLALNTELRKRNVSVFPPVDYQFWHRLAILRDPFDRFISGYIYFCLFLQNECYGCFSVHCFVVKLHRRISRLSRMGNFKLIDLVTGHALPQAWYCDFQHQLEDYRILVFNKTDEFKEEARKLLLGWGFDPAMITSGWGEDRTEQFLGTKASHSSTVRTDLKFRNELLSNMTSVDLVYRTYSIDYFMLSKYLPIPDWLVSHCQALGANNNDYLVCKNALSRTS